jgi:hypothetical protein
MVSSYSRRELSKTTRLMENVPEVLRRDRVISGPSLLDDCGGQAFAHRLELTWAVNVDLY